jgi:hypothetical protein
VAFSEENTSIATAWVFSGWVPEYFAAPPTLAVTGASMGQAIALFRLLSTVARRAITVADLSLQLPIDFRPTILLIESGQKVLASWRACSYHSVYLPAKGGALQELVCSKAIYSETDHAVGWWGEEASHIVLLPTNQLPALTEDDLNSIAAEFQPQLQLYRLRRLQSRSQPAHEGCVAKVVGTALCRELFALLADGPGMRKLLRPVVKQQQQATTDRRSVDPLAVIIEVIWAPAHAVNPLATSEVQKRVNALLRSRGEKLEYSLKEIGWKLSSLGLRRKRTASGMILQFSRQLSGQIHQLTRQLGLPLQKVDGCADCASSQVVEP